MRKFCVYGYKERRNSFVVCVVDEISTGWYYIDFCGNGVIQGNEFCLSICG